MSDTREYPDCFCPEPTPWDERRLDGFWDLEPDAPLESRTCLECGATKSVEMITDAKGECCRGD